MIGSDPLADTFGTCIPGDFSTLPNVVRAAIRSGFSPILLKYRSKEPVCILSTAQVKKADDQARADALAAGATRVDGIRHECGKNHVMNDPAKVGTIITRLSSQHSPEMNLGVHLGRSGLVAIDMDTKAERDAFEALPWAAPITVESPGAQDRDGNWVHFGGGHTYYRVPDGFTPPTLFKGPGGWSAMSGNSYVLVPPSVRHEGAYRLVGGVHDMPPELLALLAAAPVRELSRESVTIAPADNPIEAWSARTGWESLLLPDGWRQAGTRYTCGCPNWTAPGPHASSKSATAHEPGCSVFDTSTGWGPLKLWTDHPPAGLPPEGAVTLFDYVARVHFGGRLDATKDAIGVPRSAVVPTIDPKVLAGMGRELRIEFASEMTMRAATWTWETDIDL